MTERMAFGAMVILLAAGGLLSASSSKGAAIAGIYTATGVDATYVLTLRADASADLVGTPTNAAGTPLHESGNWSLEGTAVQLNLAGSGDSELRSVVTLVPNGTTLGVQDVAGRDPRFRGLSFVNNGTAQPASDVRPSSPTSPVGEQPPAGVR